MKKHLAICLILISSSAALTAQQRRSVTEKIEWTYSDKAEKPDPALPNVLLIGDSITRAYYRDVANHLSGKANCFYFATSASIADVRLPSQLAEYFNMMNLQWDVVHFNNGMHGWGYKEQEYQTYFPEMLSAVRAGAPKARLVWSSTTPVRKDQDNGATNPRIVARNAIAAEFAIRQHIPIDDQHALMLTHQDLHSDDVHFTPEGSAIQGEHVAASIAELLPQQPSGKLAAR